ncbi:ATP-binding protein [Streptomyces kunmingensis]|uniref:ATP-binding protein n=1 Tax=Streptomyces kunmingensis TaxID=68225 RepID=A0ABU6CGQ3_9ACTN|nr:ATP-binding protein [Streptomyces kunmingensis]MEB3963888.1 ATP-binding protein [Streptomyces kunmingensis]
MGAPEASDTERYTCAQVRTDTSEALVPLCADLTEQQARRLREDALLVASELASNALRHGGGIARYSARVRGGALVVEVSDHSPQAPLLRPHDPAVPGGFGWMMVNNLARTVTVEAHERGKTIRAALDTASYR